MSTVRAGRVGSTTASPGRSTPGSDRSRSRAVATMPPVDPAETTAAASPRLTSWHATATLDRGRRRLASAPSPMVRLSSAGTIWISSMAPRPPSTWRSRAAGPVSRIRTPCSRWAASAPATISPGAWSPPMASTAITGRMRPFPTASAEPGPEPVTAAGAGPGPGAGSPSLGGPSLDTGRSSWPSGPVLRGSPGCAAADGTSFVACPSPHVTSTAGLVAPLWP